MHNFADRYKTHSFLHTDPTTQGTDSSDGPSSTTGPGTIIVVAIIVVAWWL